MVKMLRSQRERALQKKLNSHCLSIVGLINRRLWVFFFFFPFQETDELYIVSQFFVEEWRKFVR